MWNGIAGRLSVPGGMPPQMILVFGRWLGMKGFMYESLIFASEVIRALHGGEEDYPPPDLTAGVLPLIAKVIS